MKRLFLLLCPFLFCLSACKDKSSDVSGPAQSSISCTPRAKNLELKGGEVIVSVVCDGQWTASATKSWVEVFPQTGYGSIEGVSVSVAEGAKDSATVFFVSANGDAATLTLGRGIDVESIAVDDEGGVLPGLFSVSSGRRVRFSSGNLQYNAAGTHITAEGEEAKGEWRFAPHQWDVAGKDNDKIDENNENWIDLFGWGTSGWDNRAFDTYAANFEPWSVSDTVMFENYNIYGYGPSANRPDVNLTGTSRNHDWGVFNAISNAGDEPGKWRTLTAAEWYYLWHSRTNAVQLRGQATVMKVHGYLIFPDGTNMEQLKVYFTSNPNDWTTNNYTSAVEWDAIRQFNPVFLPCAGRRYGTEVDNVTSWGVYWSSTADGAESAKAIGFFENSGKHGLSFHPYLRYRAFSVRLVQM